eukprot:10347584-Alexandrium_andersonii.AAC.1
MPGPVRGRKRKRRGGPRSSLSRQAPSTECQASCLVGPEKHCAQARAAPNSGHDSATARGLDVGWLRLAVAHDRGQGCI